MEGFFRRALFGFCFWDSHSPFDPRVPFDISIFPFSSPIPVSQGILVLPFRSARSCIMKHAFFSLLLPFRPLACRRSCPPFAGYASSRALLLPCSPHVPILLRDDIFSHSLLHPKLPSYLSHKKGTAALRPTVLFRHFHPFLAALCPGKNEPACSHKLPAVVFLNALGFSRP